MEREFLYKIGLTKGETEVYLALLKIGQSSIGKIVEISMVTKSKVYDILNRLRSKGLVSTSIKNKIQLYDAASPQFLLDYLSKKEEELVKQKTELLTLLPQLMKIQSSASKKERVEIFEGFRGLKNAFQIAENEFEENEEFLVLGVDKTLNIQQLQFFIQYHKRRVEKKVKTKVIFTSNLRGVREYHQKKGRYNEERFLNQTSAVPINIYKDMIMIPLLESEEKEIAIFIRNKKLAEGFRQYFYTLWKISKT